MTLIKTIKRKAWDLDRFGLSPRKLCARLMPSNNAPPIIIISMPKSGTHLVERALCLHPKIYRSFHKTIVEGSTSTSEFQNIIQSTKPGQLLISHYPFHNDLGELLKKKNFKVILMIRDPRDVVLSRYNYLLKEKEHKYHNVIAQIENKEERINAAIEGNNEYGFLSIGALVDTFHQWADYADIVVRFEDLVGAQGGGEKAAQDELVNRIFDTINFDLSNNQRNLILSKLYSDLSPTFFTSGIAKYKKELSTEQDTRVQSLCRSFMATYHYIENA